MTHALAVFLIPLLWVPFETLLVSLLGTTPGKALFGIHIRDQKERKLSVKLSFKRAILTWIKGMGGNLPIANIVCGTYQFNKIKKTGQSTLDEQLGVHTYHKTKRSLRTVLSTALLALFSLFFVAEYEVREVVTSSEQTFFSKTSSTSLPNPHWTQYQDPEGAYSIQFPGTPESKSTELAIPRSKEKLPLHAIKYELGQQGVEYSLNYTTLPSSWLKWRPALLLKGALKILASHLSQAKIVKKSSKSYNNYPALEFVLMKKNNLHCSGRLVLVDNVLYKIDVTYPEELEEEIQEHMESFLDSFNIKAP